MGTPFGYPFWSCSIFGALVHRYQCFRNHYILNSELLNPVTVVAEIIKGRVANLPASYRSLSGPSGPKCPKSVRENGGVRGSVPWGVFRALRAPGSGASKTCPESVQRRRKEEEKEGEKEEEKEEENEEGKDR